MPHERHATVAGFVAQDVIVGAELPTAEDVRRSVELCALRVVLGFGQTPISAETTVADNRDSRCRGVIAVKATQQHKAFATERDRGGILERRGKHAYPSLAQRQGDLRGPVERCSGACTVD